MKNKEKTNADTDILRRKAEELLHSKLPQTPGRFLEADGLKLLHELMVQQVELELQNTELEQAINNAQEAIDLFDFAPTGYFTLNQNGSISKLNFRGSQLLGKERSKLIDIQFENFLSNDTQPVFNNFLKKIFETSKKQSCEVTLSIGEKLLILNLTGIITTDKQHCLISSLDINEIKLLEKANLARLHLLQFADSHTLDQLLEETLNQAEILTGSLIGFYHFVEADQKTLHLQNWSTRTKKEFCRAEGKWSHYDISLAGVWTDCIREGKAVIHNDYSALTHKKGLPPGHAPILREMVIPVYRNGKIMAILGVGNKPAEYNDQDIESVSLLADLAWDITGRKKAEEALQLEMRNFSAVFESSPVAMLVIDDKTNIVLANLAAVALSGGSESDFLQHRPGNALRCIHSSKDPRGCGFSEDCRFCKLRNGIEALITQGGYLHGAEVEIDLYRNEEICKIWLKIGIEPLLFSGRKHWCIALVDITNSKRVEKELLESEEKFRTVADFTYDWEYWEADDGHIIYMSPSCKRVSGYSIAEFLADRSLFQKIIHPRDLELVNAKNEILFKTGHFYDIIEHDYRIIKKDGSIAFINSISRPVFETEGNYNGRRISNRDITLRKKSEYELIKKDALLNITGETAQVGGWELDTETSDQTWTDEVYRIHEINFPFEPNVRNGLSFYAPNSRPVIENAVKRAIEQGESFDLELEFYTNKKNHRWVHAIGKAYQENGITKKVYGSIQDITERKKTEEELKQKNEALVKINAEKDKFFSIIAHDLRGPFNGFLGLTQVMAESLPSLSMDDLQAIISSLRKSATNLYSLLGNLLEWSQLQRGLTPFNPESIAVKPKVLEIIGQASEFISKKEIAVKIEIPEDLFVYADSYMLSGIIRNLLNNAIKFTPAGGYIFISATANSDHSGEFLLKDSGIGMDKNILDNLFNHDMNTNRRGTEGEPSTGLGLIICKDLIEKHGGTLWIESEAGEGSSVRFILPGNS